MSVELCPQAVTCECDDSPILNRTEEADEPVYIGECVRCGADDPPLGEVFYRRGCRGWALSTVSQLDADLQAAAQEATCADDGDDGGGRQPIPVPDPWTPTPNTRIGGDTFASEAIGVSCANGHNLHSFEALPDNLSIDGPTLTVAAGAFTAATQEAANALAATYVNDFMEDGLDAGDLICFPNCANGASTTARPRIKDYTPTYFDVCPGCAAFGAPEWDGTFPIHSAPTCAYRWDTQTGFNDRSINTRHAQFLDLISDNITLTWRLRVVCAGDTVFDGHGPSTAHGPAGVYTVDVASCGGRVTAEVDYYMP